jgi:hypothetical protein
MSTVEFDTLRSSGQITGTAKSVDTDYVVSGSAKAWISFDAKDTVVVYHSLNHSSLTDNGTGNFNNTLSNSLVDGNYCFNATCGRSPNVAGTDVPLAYMADDAFVPTTNAYRVYSAGVTIGLQDQDRNFQVLHGDLA